MPDEESRRYYRWKRLDNKTSVATDTTKQRNTASPKREKRRLKGDSDKAKVPPIPIAMMKGSEMYFPSEAPKPGTHEAVREISAKMMHNPLVPIGIGVTCYFLVMSFVSSLRRDQHKMQYYMRGRVTAQGATIIFLVAGAYYLANRTNNDDGERMEQNL